MQTNGWDTVYALAATELNGALAASSASFPSNISYSDPSSPISFTGVLGPWSINGAGSGQFLGLTIPFVSGQLVDDDKGSFDLAGVGVTVLVSLKLLTQASVQTLCFDLQSAAAVGATPAAGAVTPLELTNPGSLSELQQYVVLEAVANYLTANAGAIEFFLASMNLAPPGGSTWVTPAVSAYTTITSGADVYLVILSMTSAVDVSGLAAVADPAILAAGCNAAFVVSGDHFLSAAVLPVLPAAFGDTTAPLEFNAASHAIVNTANVPMPGVKKGLITYHPELTSYTMTIVGNTLPMIAEVYCSLGAGIDCKFTVSAVSTAVYDAATQSLTIQQDPNPTVHHDDSIPWYLVEFGPIVDAVLTVLNVEVSQAAASALNRVATLKTPPITVEWAAKGSLQVTNAGISTSFFLQGNWG